MPELPEVETTRLGLVPHLVGRTVAAVTVRERRLRWPVAAELETALVGQTVLGLERRAKYLLLQTRRGWALIHLGMSGSLAILTEPRPVAKHDHLELALEGGVGLRYTDPRRFGAWLWTPHDPAEHPLLRHLGPEPLAPTFDAAYLSRRARLKRTAIKTLIMDQRVVVGVGNIYANEALFAAAIDPHRMAGSVAPERFPPLVAAIQRVLTRAIAAGGTTLRDFVDGQGRPGYFQQQLAVYGRGGEPCRRCGGVIVASRLGQRATYHCPGCQG